MKIVSLLPAATEMVCLIGLKANLVGISDDSDYPVSVAKLPKITTTTLDPSLSSLEIDKAVKASKHSGISIFHIDRLLLSRLAPDLIVTQELCPVCAPAFSEVEKTARKILQNTQIISLEPHTITDIFTNIKQLGRVTEKILEAEQSVASLKKRLLIVSQKVKRLYKPTVLILEWLDPLMIAGHWVPEMVERAGGKMLIAKKKERSKEISWKAILQADPDIWVIAPCGFSIKRTRQELDLITKRKGFKRLKACKNNNVFLIDGNVYLTRPGPRIIDGVEILSQIFHTEVFPRVYPQTSCFQLDFSNLL